ncbi:P-loop containing nucleoside triphosphate hydrolase protein [Rozella allomycis CSF55]|uniref:RNA helicase n=1 Tax=Rozella allomycis (strain CSF55) TaxID=988480 RepID=A0A4P9YJE0_ROZAC|nr:P-loop containing nucleoside triphosphate hydrolase protein [Rozella allomycis CSF55]
MVKKKKHIADPRAYSTVSVKKNKESNTTGDADKSQVKHTEKNTKKVSAKETRTKTGTANQEDINKKLMENIEKIGDVVERSKLARIKFGKRLEDQIDNGIMDTLRLSDSDILHQLHANYVILEEYGLPADVIENAFKNVNDCSNIYSLIDYIFLNTPKERLLKKFYDFYVDALEGDVRIGHVKQEERILTDEVNVEIPEINKAICKDKVVESNDMMVNKDWILRNFSEMDEVENEELADQVANMKINENEANFEVDIEKQRKRREVKVDDEETMDFDQLMDAEYEEPERIGCLQLHFRDFTISKWSGKTPKTLLQEYCQKNASKLAIKDIECNLNATGYMCKAVITGKINKEFTMEKECCSTKKEAEHFVSTIALHEIMSEKKSFKNLLPPVFRDLWIEFDNKNDNVVDGNEKRRIDFISTEMSNLKFEKPKVSLKTKFENSEIRNFQNRKLKSIEEVKKVINENQNLESYKNILKERQELPIFQARQEIIDEFNANQVIVVSGMTGSGKSTQLPQIILMEEILKNRNVNIICSQPRRISAISIAERVSLEVGDSKCGRLVGYQIKQEKCDSEFTRLLYCTNGVLLRRLEIDPDLRDVTCVIIDEVHERILQVDFLLIMMKRLIAKRSDFNNFEQNLKNYSSTTLKIKNNQTGRIERFQISDESLNLQDSSNSLLDKYNESILNLDLILNLIEVICNEEPYRSTSGSILVFLPGWQSIQNLLSLIESSLFYLKDPSSFWILPLHSALASNKQSLVFKIPPKNVRKIVLSTNIAETGVTIPDVVFVIDSGKSKEIKYNALTKVESLTEKFISVANANQRKGRAGRVQEGYCFKLYSRKTFDKMKKHQQCEMKRLPLEQLCLKIKLMNIDDIRSFLEESLDPPSNASVKATIEALQQINALDSAESLTTLGCKIASLPIDIMLAKLLILSLDFQCLDFALTIAALASHGKSIFTDKIIAFAKYGSDVSDWIASWNAYRAWRKCHFTGVDHPISFARKNSFSHGDLVLIEETKIYLSTQLTTAEEYSETPFTTITKKGVEFLKVDSDLDISSQNDKIQALVLGLAFYPNFVIARQNKLNLIDKFYSDISLHPTSLIKQEIINKYLQENDQREMWLVAYKLLHSSRLFLMDVSNASFLSLILSAKSIEVIVSESVIIVDKNIQLKCSPMTGVIAKQLNLHYQQNYSKTVFFLKKFYSK